MTKRPLSFQSARNLALALGIAMLGTTACDSDTQETGDTEVGGSSGNAGVSGSGGASGASTGGASTGGASTGGAPSGGSGAAGGSTATGGQGSGGSSGASGGVGAGTGGSNGGSGTDAGAGGTNGGKGGGAGSGGTVAGSGGTTGGVGGLGGNGAGGKGAGAGSGGGTTGPARSLGYVGCSMSVNVAQGYQTLGGMRLWQPISAYNGKVVQNWANTNDSVWQSFEQQARTNGTPTAVWVMICIFTNMVTYDETKQIIANVRQRAPNAEIYITGQPLYAQGLTCDLSGAGGPEKTDMMAQMAGEDASLQNVTYGGTFGPLNSSQRSDSCHANADGQRLLGQQAIMKFGN